MVYKRADCRTKPIQISTNITEENWKKAKEKNVKWVTALAVGIRVLTDPTQDPKWWIRKFNSSIREIQELHKKLDERDKIINKLARIKPKKAKNVFCKSTPNKRDKKRKISTSKKGGGK